MHSTFKKTSKKNPTSPHPQNKTKPKHIIWENWFFPAIPNRWLMAPKPCQTPGFDVLSVLRSEPINKLWHCDTDRQ